MLNNSVFRRLSLICLAVLLSACNEVTSTGSVSTYSARNQSITVCSGYGCILKGRFSFSSAEELKLKKIMKPGAKSAKQERKAIRSAIATMEKMARAHLRYRPDIAFSYQKNAAKRGQMDCIDESLNTISYLNYLSGKKLLHYHRVHKTYAERGLIIDGRYPHKSARIRDHSGVSWAIDSWKGPDGAKPEVMLLTKWYKDRNRASDYSRQ